MPEIAVESLGAGLLRTSGADVDIAFRVRGSGPAVVMLHGTSASHAVWEPVAVGLADEATTIAVDQRGHGRSAKPASGYSADRFAGDVVTVLDALHVDEAVVVGHSLGARNAWVAAARHPERIAGVVCVDYTPWVEVEVLDVLLERVAAGDRRFRSDHEVRSYLQARYPSMPADAVARRAEWGYEQEADGTLRPFADPRAMRQLIAGFRTPWDDEFRAFRAPARHIRGARSRIVSEAAWARAITARPEDHWLVVADADHYVPEESADVVADEIRRVLAPLERTDTQISQI